MSDKGEFEFNSVSERDAFFEKFMQSNKKLFGDYCNQYKITKTNVNNDLGTFISAASCWKCRKKVSCAYFGTTDYSFVSFYTGNDEENNPKKLFFRRIAKKLTSDFIRRHPKYCITIRIDERKPSSQKAKYNWYEAEANSKEFINCDTWEITLRKLTSEQELTSSLKELIPLFCDYITQAKDIPSGIAIKNTSNLNEKDYGNDMIKTAKKLLQVKRNIILQGAPGTGKTYSTAALALAVLGMNDVDFKDHEAVMKKYNELLIKFDDNGNLKNDGQIGFVTFHQSMDYEDFVEGIKPVVDDSDTESSISYQIHSGIFKAFSQKAQNKKTSNFNEAYNKLKNDLQKQGCIDNEKYLVLKTSGRQSKFGISLNKKGNLKLWTGKKENDFNPQGVLTRENMLRAISSEKVFEGWEGYSQSVISYLKNKCNLNIVQNDDVKNYVLIIDEINRGNVSKIFGELISLLEADKRIGGDHHLTVTLPYSKESFSVPSNLYIIGTMNTTDRSIGSIDYAVRRRFAFYTLKADEKAIENYYRNKDESVKKIAIERFEKVKKFLDNRNNLANDICFDDLMVGHSYFMAKDEEELNLKWDYEILPLLREYQKDGLLKRSAKIDEILNIKLENVNDSTAEKFQ